MACPNKQHPDWKALVSEIGEIAAMQAYIDNGNDIPNLDGSKKSKRRKVIIEQEYDNNGRFFNSRSTLDSLEKHPEVARKMIDELHQLFPWVQVNKDGLFDNDGKWLPIPEGKQGRHYRNAFTSAVAWSNDSSIETPPHEYAHEYIEMNKNSDIVQEGIRKYGEERLVTLIGRKYAGNRMSGSFEEYLAKFWKMIKNTFGSPSVVDILTDSFAKNEKLAEPIMSETAVHNFQDIVKPKHNRSSISNFNEDVRSSQNKIMTREWAISKIEEVIKDDKTIDDAIGSLESWWTILKSKSRNLTKDAKGDVTNYAGMDSSIIEYVDSVLFEKGDNAAKESIIGKLKGEDVELSAQENIALNTMLNLIRAVDKRVEVNSSYLENDRVVSDTIVNDISRKEIDQSIRQRKKNLDSQNKYVRGLGETLNKVLKYVTNTRLWAKYLSGGENTMFSTLVYKKLNEAREDFARFRQDFEDMFTSEEIRTLFDGSEFHNPKADIENIETDSFTLDRELNNKIWNELESKDIVLTKAEQVTVYLMDRQDDKSRDLRSGITLDKIEGRNYDLSHEFVLSEEQILDIVERMKNDPAVSEFVKSIDNATEYSYENVNPQFRKLNGYNLDKYDNYFPTYHGAQNLKISKKKNVVEDMRSMMLRLPDAGAVRLVDPFKTLANIKMSNASYSAYAIPIHNAQKAIDSVEKKFNTKDDLDYIRSLQGSIDKIQDSGSLYSSHAENDLSKAINKMQGNFAVGLLAKNLGVVLKQQASLETATNEISRKYIRKAGASLGPVSFVNPFKLLKALTFSGEETMMPIEWTQAEKSEEYNTLIKYPLFRERMSGTISKESGEAIMGREIAEDKIKMPFIKKDGKPVYVTKQRLMKGITIMDTLTIIRLFNAVKYETQDRMSEAAFQNMTEEQIEQHNVNRLQEIIDKTQPTFDQLNRTGLSQSNNPIARSLTMFTSATSKMGMGLTESLIDYLNNPTQEAGMKFVKRLVSTGVITSAMITTIDLMRHAALNGWSDDDDDELFERYALSSLTSTVGSIQAVGGVLGIVMSQLDSNPWYKTMQDPTQHIIQEGSEGIANLVKGNFARAAHQSVGTYSKVTGLPFSIYSNTEKIIKRVTN